MKGRRKYLAWLPALAFLFVVLLLPGTGRAETAGKEINIAFTHDTHSHFEPNESIVNGEKREIGGMARIKTLLDELREEDPETLVIDGGDFSMGTLYQSLYNTEALELRLLGILGYDATTVGNHEFDYTGKEFAAMLKAAAASGDPLPAFVTSAIDLEQTEPETAAAIREAYELYGVQETLILEKNGVRIGLFGNFGDDAEDCSPNSGVVFRDHIETAKEAVEQLKDQTDLIICLSHGGTWEEEKKSEDQILAREVPEIDLILSGHTHSTLEEPILEGDTVIVSCGEYGMNLGNIRLSQEEDGSWKVESYRLIPVDESVEAEEEITALLKEYKALVSEQFLKGYGYEYDQVLAVSPFDFSELKAVSEEHVEHTLGSLIADSYVNAVKKAEGDQYEEVTLAVVPSGVIRETFTKGEITVSDAFLVSSLGYGPDGTCGYPLVSVYLTGEEIQTAAEVDASISDIMTTARLFFSGVNFTFNPNRLILNRVTEISKVQEDGALVPLEKDRLYRVVAGLYSAQMLSLVESQSFGILSITPKDKEGNKITDFNVHIIKNQDGSEAKEWIALADYLDSFPEENGVSVIPEEYSAPQGRKIVNDSRNLIELLKNPNRIAVVMVLIVTAAAALLILAAVLIGRRIRRNKNRRRGQERTGSPDGKRQT